MVGKNVKVYVGSSPSGLMHSLREAGVPFSEVGNGGGMANNALAAELEQQAAEAERARRSGRIRSHRRCSTGAWALTLALSGAGELRTCVLSTNAIPGCPVQTRTGLNAASNSRYQVVLPKTRVISQRHNQAPNAPAPTWKPAAPETQPLQLAPQSQRRGTNRNACR